MVRLQPFQQSLVKLPTKYEANQFKPDRLFLFTIVLAPLTYLTDMIRFPIKFAPYVRVFFGTYIWF